MIKTVTRKSVGVHYWRLNMSIVIYTYEDPYKLKSEPYWEEIKTCPYFCVSQTMVNGLKKVYQNDFSQGRVTTFQNLIEAMYPYWTSTLCFVKQHTCIDNLISNNASSFIENALLQNLAKAFSLNRDEVFESLRIMFELNINVQDIIIDKLTLEQRYIVELYKKIISDNNHLLDFKVDEIEGIAEVNAAINMAMTNAAEKGRIEIDVNKIQNDRVVIHGVHQFSPIMLRTIELLAETKKVILLFNYQPQYKKAYQTWIDIYSTFDSPISEFNNLEFHPTMDYPISYQGNVLADNLGKLINGDVRDISLNNTPDIIEFDNMTEFANYVANIFAKAEKIDSHNPMKYMNEQIYAADSSANNILKIYFPEQFGERQFLNYPLGHFFLAIANMWDPVQNELVITDINDIKECLNSGILKEEYLGQLSSIFENMTAMFDGCNSISEMISRIKKVRKSQKHLTDPVKKEYVSHISYYTIPREDMDLIESALQELDNLSAYFYEDFEKRPHNFKEFYKKLKLYLQEEVSVRGLSEEFINYLSEELFNEKQLPSVTKNLQIRKILFKKLKLIRSY